MTKPTAAELGRIAARGEHPDWIGPLARAGLVAKGVSFGIVGVLAVKVAVGAGGDTTSRQGALATLAQSGLGKVLLALLAFGFAGYAIWRLAEAFVAGSLDDSQLEDWAKRLGSLGRAVVYGGLTFSAVHILLGSGGSQSQSGKAHQTTAQVLSWPGGPWLVGCAGLAIAGAGLWNGYRGISRSFCDRWRTGEMSPAEQRWGERAGLAGHLARGAVYLLIGVFVVKAAVQYDPKEAVGLDGALARLAQQPFGPWLLGATAAGLVAYGVYCLVDARYRRVQPR